MRRRLSKIEIIGGGFVGLVLLIAIIGSAVAPHDEASALVDATAPPSGPTRQAAAAVPSGGGTATPARDSVAPLPSNRVPAGDILGHPEAVVRRRLGKPSVAASAGANDEWQLGAVTLEVEFKKGKATALTVMFPNAQRAAALAWLGLDGHGPWTLGKTTYRNTSWDMTSLRLVSEAQAQREAFEEALERRVAVARTLDQAMLSARMEVETTLHGKAKTTIRFKYALCGRVFMNDLEKNRDITDSLRDAGFTRVECTDGYRERIYFEL